MYLVREVLHCHPGQVSSLLAKFKVLCSAMDRMGYPSFRLLTDMSGERYWTLVAELEVESLDGMSDMEGAVMSDSEVQEAMSDYHNVVQSGRREIFRIEN